MKNSFINSDDRIYKYLIDEVLIINKLFFQKKIIIKEILQNLATSGVHYKYILKKIKLLSTKISLYPYFHFMIDVFYDYKVIFFFVKVFDVPSH